MKQECFSNIINVGIWVGVEGNIYQTRCFQSLCIYAYVTLLQSEWLIACPIWVVIIFTLTVLNALMGVGGYEQENMSDQQSLIIRPFETCS